MKDNLLTKKQKFLKHNGKGQEGGKDKTEPEKEDSKKNR